MAKFLKQILGDDYAEAVFPRLPNNDRDAKNHWKQNSPDAQRFVDKHAVHNFPDRNGNGDDVFNASNVETVERAEGRHGYNLGYNNPQDEDINEDVQKELNFQTDPIDKQTKAYGKSGRYKITPTESGHQLSYYSHNDRRVGFAKQLGHFPSHGLAVSAAHNHEFSLKEEEEFLEENIIHKTSVPGVAVSKCGVFFHSGLRSEGQQKYRGTTPILPIHERWDKVNCKKCLKAGNRVRGMPVRFPIKEETEEYDPELLLDEILSEMEEEDIERVIQIMENGTDEEIEQLADFLTEISKETVANYLGKTAKDHFRLGALKAAMDVTDKKDWEDSRAFNWENKRRDASLKARDKGIDRAVKRLKEDDEVEDDKKIDNLDDFITEISKDMAYRYLRKTAGENYRPGREGYGPSGQFYISKTETDRDKDRTKGIHRAIDRLAGLRKTNVYKPISG